jgi:hypothetical protein
MERTTRACFLAFLIESIGDEKSVRIDLDDSPQTWSFLIRRFYPREVLRDEGARG